MVTIERIEIKVSVSSVFKRLLEQYKWKNQGLIRLNELTI